MDRIKIHQLAKTQLELSEIEVTLAFTLTQAWVNLTLKLSNKWRFCDTQIRNFQTSSLFGWPFRSPGSILVSGDWFLVTILLTTPISSGYECLGLREGFGNKSSKSTCTIGRDRGTENEGWTGKKALKKVPSLWNINTNLKTHETQPLPGRFCFTSLECVGEREHDVNNISIDLLFIFNLK